MNRNALLSIIPKINNEDVIVYDISLSPLLNVNVFEKYNELLLEFEKNKNNFIYKNDIYKEYQNKINNSILTEKRWEEQDYIIALKNLEISYSKMFGDIKKLENNLKISENNIEKINEKIKIQQKLDSEEIENEKNEYDETMKKLKNDKIKIEYDIKIIKNDIKYAEKELELCNKEFKLLYKTYKSIEEGKECVCELCGSNINTQSQYFEIISEKVKNNTDIIKHKEKIVSDKKDELKTLQRKIKDIDYEMDRLINIKYNSNLLYTKKSKQILQLEANKRDLIKKKNFFKNELRNNKSINSIKYIELKNKIEDYKNSLQTLKDLKEINENIIPLKKELEELFALCKNNKKQLEMYIKFIKIYYKICESKINTFFGNNFKFIFADFDDIKVIELLKVFYKGIEYSQLDPQTQKECDKEYNKKINNL